MMSLWISCLLIGSITCSPVGKGYESNGADTTFMRLPFSSGYWFSGTGVSSDPGSSSFLPSLPYPSSDKATDFPASQDVISSAGPGTYSSSLQDVYSNDPIVEVIGSGYTSFGDKHHNIPEMGEYGIAYEASQSSGDEGRLLYGSYGGHYSSSSQAYEGDNSYGFVAASQDENWSSGSATNYGATHEDSEPVLSDVSDLEPVYSFSSRSSYQRGRAVFAQTRYTPGEPVPPPMPASKSVSKTVSKRRRPAKAPTRGASKDHSGLKLKDVITAT